MVRMALAVATVHTSGVNIESVGLICGVILTGLGLVISWQVRSNRSTRDAIRMAVDHLAEVLNGKLESKDEVSHLRERLAKLETTVELNRQGRNIPGGQAS